MSQGSAQVHYNKVLSDIAVQFRPPELSWEQIAPRRGVQKESDLWPVFDRDLFMVPMTHRADGDPANETTLGWRYDNYICTEHALRDILTARMRDNADDEIGLEAAIVENVKQQVWNGIELNVFGPNGLVRNTNNNAYTATANWATLATASPRTDIQRAIDAVERNTGRSPNTIAMSRLMARHITRTAEFRDEAKYTVDIRNEDLLSELYGLKAVYVGSLLNITAAGAPRQRGQEKVLERVMGNDVWVGYVNPAMGYRDITFALTLFTKEYASMWWDPARRSDIIEYGMIYQNKLIARECGGLIQVTL